MKKNKKFFLGIIVGILFSSVGVYASTTYLARNVTYKNTTVEAALNELYKKAAENADDIDYNTNDIAISNSTAGTTLTGLEVGKKYIMYARINSSSAPKIVSGANIIKNFILIDNFTATEFTYKYPYIGIIETNMSTVTLENPGVLFVKLLNN